MAEGFAGRRGRRPLRFAREWAAAGACPSSGPAGPPSPKGEGKGCNPSRGVGGRFPGRRGRRPLRFAREWAAAGACPSSGPAGPPSPKGEGKGCNPSRGVGGRFPGRRGRRPLRFAREWAAAGACPSSGPAGPPSPKGEGKGCCWRRREVAAGWGHPALRMGIWKRPRGLRGHPFPGRRTVGAGHARPGGFTQAPVNGSVRREGS